jgi:hypothetical protein
MPSVSTAGIGGQVFFSRIGTNPYYVRRRNIFWLLGDISI